MQTKNKIKKGLHWVLDMFSQKLGKTKNIKKSSPEIGAIFGQDPLQNQSKAEKNRKVLKLGAYLSISCQNN